MGEAGFGPISLQDLGCIAVLRGRRVAAVGAKSRQAWFSLPLVLLAGRGPEGRG